MMLSAWIVLTVAALNLQSADAPPRFDVEAYCAEVADAGGGSSMIKNSCLKLEQAAYNALKPVWTSVPIRIQTYCVEVATVSGPGSYSMLKSCIEMEQDSAQEADQFEFDY